MIENWGNRVRQIQCCRICGNSSLEPVIDLGAQALSCLFDDGQPHNQLSTPIPLEVVRCAPGGNRQEVCGFIQLKHTVPAEIMFRDYGYRSGINTTMCRHLEDLSRDIESRIPLKSGDIAVDIGANDGTSLLGYRTPGLIKAGFEPSDVRPENPHHGIQYLPFFFSAEEFLRAFPGKKALVVTSIAMFYDIDHPAEFCREISRVLSEDGLWVIEVGTWGAILENNGFDSICHEHLGYYTLEALNFLFKKTGFELCDVRFNSANGGSVRCYVKKKGGSVAVSKTQQERIAEAFRQEEEKGIHLKALSDSFRKNSRKIRQDLVALLTLLRSQGKKAYGYGASTKGNVLLQYCGIGPEFLTAIADRNPAKWGRLTPGTRIPICSEDQMRRDRPDALLILPWHFLEEFLDREKPLRAQGTRFIVPLPQVRWV